MIEDELKPTGNRIIGLDCSTHSLAWAVLNNDLPVSCGEVTFKGSNTFERLNSARQVTQALVDEGVLVGDYVGIEAAVYVSNMQTAIKLAYVFGAVMSVLMQNKLEVIEVAPIAWQTGIGVPILTKAEKEQLRRTIPGKSDSWYKNKGRLIRKLNILKIGRKLFDISDGSDNVGDAAGIARFVSTSLTKRG